MKSIKVIKDTIKEAIPKVTFTDTGSYYVVQSGKKYWYWTKDGKFDGTSWDVE